MRRRGFTLVELSIVLTLLIILAPLVYQMALDYEDRMVVSSWHLQTADGVRSVADALAQDRSAGAPVPGDAIGFVHNDGACTVTYALDETRVVRSDSCTGDQVLASGVSALDRHPSGVTITFSRRLRTDRVRNEALFIGVRWQ